MAPSPGLRQEVLEALDREIGKPLQIQAYTRKRDCIADRHAPASLGSWVGCTVDFWHLAPFLTTIHTSSESGTGLAVPRHNLEEQPPSMALRTSGCIHGLWSTVCGGCLLSQGPNRDLVQRTSEDLAAETLQTL